MLHEKSKILILIHLPTCITVMNEIITMQRQDGILNIEQFQTDFHQEYIFQYINTISLRSVT